jgi:hypothetical protein
MDIKDFLGILAAVLNIVVYAAYFRGIFKGQVHPHFFSWFIWAILTSIGYAAQVYGGGGPGTWVTGVSAAVCFVIAALAVKYGEKTITRSDWLAFIGCLAAIPLWMITHSPVWSVILITVIDATAFWPTFRKTWARPHEESMFAFAGCSIKFAVGIAALDQFSIVTVLYPASLVVMNAAFVAFTILRRKALITLALTRGGVR